MTLVRTRNTAVLWVIGLYLLLNYGFMQLRLPPGVGSGVPIGEIVLVLSLLTINHFTVIYRLHTTAFIFPFLLWWGYGIGSALAAVPAYGFWALRDATHVIESLFLIVGFAFAARPEHLNRVFEWLPRLLLFVGIYALSYPIGETLQAFSPSIRTGAGHDTPLFFSYTSTSLLLLLAAAYLMLFKERTKWTLVLEGFLIGYAAFLFQARTIYIQIFVLLIFFLIFRRQVLGKGAIGMTLMVLALLIIPLAGIEIQGRLGQKISFEFIVNHVLAIGGVESEGVQGAARGVSLRFGWWEHLIGRWLSSFQNFVLGLGFGIPLTDFTSASGAIVREPHNSYLSVIGRTGITGAIAFVWMHFLLLRIWWRTYRTCQRNRWREGENRLLILMVFFVLIWVSAMGEDTFEKPYFAIPYYFFWGLVLKMSWFLRTARKAKSQVRDAPRRVAPQAAAHAAARHWAPPSGPIHPRQP